MSSDKKLPEEFAAMRFTLMRRRTDAELSSVLRGRLPAFDTSAVRRLYIGACISAPVAGCDCLSAGLAGLRVLSVQTAIRNVCK
jgi:hypothetical protein